MGMWPADSGRPMQPVQGAGAMPHLVFWLASLSLLLQANNRRFYDVWSQEMMVQELGK